VESEPAGATVSVNGEAKGPTPLDLESLAFSKYEIRLELKGYETRTRSVELTAENPKGELKVVLPKTAPAQGIADVLSTPFGASVTIDGKKVGQTPLADFKLPPGVHQVEMSREGYEDWIGSVKVEPGKRTRIDQTLKAIPVATPPPPAKIADPARIYTNDLSAVDVIAKKVSGSFVTYPDNAPKQRSGEQASVMVTFVVDENGDVVDPKVVQSAGKVLDEAVVSAVKNWKYAPATKGGVKVKVRIDFKQTFRAG